MAKRLRPPTATAPAIPPTGTAGAVPPAHAPREHSQPLQPGAGGVVYADGTRMTPAARAQQNARQLAPLVGPPAGPPTPVASAVPGKAIDGVDPFYANLPAPVIATEPPALAAPPVGPLAAPSVPQPPPASRVLRRDRRVGIPRPPVPDEGAPASPSPVLPARPDATMTAATDAPAPLTEAERQRMPAASNTDSPARGVVRNPLAPGKEITGGFGPPASLQYFALNGVELFKLVEALMDALHARCQNDIRFQEHLVYPRVTARVVIEIEGFTRDADFSVQQVLLPNTPAASKNPVAFARTVADQVAFVLIAQHEEVDKAGATLVPPGQVRDDLCLPQPGKRMITSGGRQTFVDVE